MIAPSPFAMPLASSFDPECGLFNLRRGRPTPWEFNGWKAESLSWKKTCYIHGGLSGPSTYTYSGPDAEKFLAGICINNFSKFAIGTAKHAIMVTEEGLIAAQGVMQRRAADTFRIFACGKWPAWQHSRTKLDVHQQLDDRYLFQVAGPTSLQTLEAATGESLRDVKFLRFRDVNVAGHRAEIMRIGMAGSLAYELHGPIAEGPAVYDAVFRAGQPYGIERLGWKTYFVNHVEGGFPQVTWTFHSASHEDQAFLDFNGRSPSAMPIVSGSVDPQDMRARYRTPHEVGWQSSIRLDHDFIGRPAIEKELADPRRTIVTLVWNPEDVIDVYASLFRAGDEFTEIELPISPHNRGLMAHADHVTLADGRPVGYSSGTIFSYYYRQMLSLCTIDIASAKTGTEVIVKWGDHGKRIKDIRATVSRFPYLNEGRNQDVDLAAIPSGVPTK